MISREGEFEGIKSKIHLYYTLPEEPVSNKRIKVIEPNV
jgi:hypothetical protein